MGTCLDLFGVTMVLLTTKPIGKLLFSLDLTIHIRHLVVFFMVLPLITLAELPGVQKGW